MCPVQEIVCEGEDDEDQIIRKRARAIGTERERQYVMKRRHFAPIHDLQGRNSSEVGKNARKLVGSFSSTRVVSDESRMMIMMMRR